MIATVIVTGTNGFLGQCILDQVAQQLPLAEIIPLSYVRAGDLDLTSDTAQARLLSTIKLTDPSQVLLIHAAAIIEWNTSAALTANAAMAVNVAQWARSVGIAFSVLVSSVSVFPAVPKADVGTPCEPLNLYGLGKWTAERVWQLCLPRERQATVRMAGLWGWQSKPTLFWNRLMLAASCRFPSQPRPEVKRRHSRRNYISVHDAARCLVGIGKRQQPGLYLAAGKDIVDTGQFIEALSNLPGSRLDVDWKDDGGVDESLYEPSPELVSTLTPFQAALAQLWAERPSWAIGTSQP